MRASIAAESVGVPTVSLVCEGFEGQADATGRGLGFDGLRLAVLRGHVDAQSSDEMTTSFVDHTLDEVIDGLTAPVGDAATATAATDTNTTAAAAGPDEPRALDVVASGTIAELHDLFAARGWSDGLPFIPPTREAVERFIEPSGHDPWRVIGTARPAGRDITVWSVAVNAVMAGCGPELLPVLLPAAEIIAGDRYGVEHSGNTTGADALMIVSGPTMAALGFNSGAGALREGARANTTVGRWLRLFLRNVCGFTADQHDKATFGNSARVVLAEDRATLDQIGWPSIARDGSTEVTCAATDDVVTMVRINSGAIVGSVFGSTPDEIVPYLGDGLARIAGWDLTHVHGLGHDQFAPLLIISPNIAHTLARSGWTKDDLRAALFDRARIPAARFERLIGEWTNLTAGRRSLADLVEAGQLPAVFAASDDPERLVPIVTRAERIIIAVSGDPHRANAYVMANDGPHGWWTSQIVDVERSSDLDCVVQPGS